MARRFHLMVGHPQSQQGGREIRLRRFGVEIVSAATRPAGAARDRRDLEDNATIGAGRDAPRGSPRSPTIQGWPCRRSMASRPLHRRLGRPDARRHGGMRRPGRALKRGARSDAARAATIALALAWPDERRAGDGTVDGRIVWPPRGWRRAGYDPSTSQTATRTTAEMSDAESAVSHRGRVRQAGRGLFLMGTVGCHPWPFCSVPVLRLQQPCARASSDRRRKALLTAEQMPA
jgi:hypothetical protein